MGLPLLTTSTAPANLSSAARLSSSFRSAASAQSSVRRGTANSAGVGMSRRSNCEMWSDSADSTSSTKRANESESRSLTTPRSEEHTSELQSRLHLVCRLLLEKKKKKHIQCHYRVRA